MNEELKNLDCTNCANYAEFAYFCMAKNTWYFPEDRPPDCKDFKQNDLEFNGVETI